MSTQRQHDDLDRLDCITILPPPAVPCNVRLTPHYDGPSHFVTKSGLPSLDCEHPECVVSAVHRL